MTTIGGPAHPAIQSSAPVQGGPAMPVAFVDGVVQGGPARPIRFVTDRPVQGGPAVPIQLVASGPVEAGAAVPVTAIGEYVYTGKVVSAFGDSLIAYWPLAEASDTIAHDISGYQRNGVYSNVALGQAGIGDGRTAASFNGTTSAVAGFVSKLAPAFNPNAGTAIICMKVSGAGVWTDATIRRALLVGVNTSNRVALGKGSSNNQVTLAYIAGGTTVQTSLTPFSNTGWVLLGITWDVVANEVRTYVIPLGGAALTATLSGLGTWAGKIVEGQCFVGAGVSGNVMSGFLAHAALGNRALPDATILQFGQV